jgi:peptide/nickel transport system substrate-binding protein
MTKMMLTNRSLHPMAEAVAQDFKTGRTSRREFFATMAALGASATGALALGGLTARKAQAAETPVKGGTLRVAMNIKAFRDRAPRRRRDVKHRAQCNEYLVRWNRDFTFEPWLLEGWEASDDAKTLT